MNQFFALGDPTRLRIVEMLAANGQMPVGDITKRFKMTAPAISQHLKVLREAKLVGVKVNGQQRLYSVNPQGMEDIQHWVTRMKQYWEERFDALEELLLLEIAKNKKPRSPK